MYSPTFLSISFIRFWSADTCIRDVDADYLSFIISALFSDMAVCISEHIRPYYYNVNVLRSIPLESMTYWLCSNVQLFTTFLSKFFNVVLASISCYLMNFVNSLYYLS